MAKLNLSPPWVIYYRQVNALFQLDPEVKVIYDDEKYLLKIFVDDNPKKAEALTQLLPSAQIFGKVTLQIQVIPSNALILSENLKYESRAELLKAALDENGAVNYIQTVSGMFNIPATYIVFRNEVVQYFTDDLSDAHGLCSTLYQDIAKKIFGEDEGCYFCTDLPDTGYIAVGTPLGEWP